MTWHSVAVKPTKQLSVMLLLDRLPRFAVTFSADYYPLFKTANIYQQVIDQGSADAQTSDEVWLFTQQLLLTEACWKS